jgi:hypothetical protein
MWSKGISRKQAQRTNNRRFTHRQQTAAQAHMTTIRRYEVRRNPAPRRDIRLRLQDEQSTHPQAQSKATRNGGEIAEGGTPHEQSQDNEQSDQHRQQTAARARVTITRH